MFACLYRGTFGDGEEEMKGGQKKINEPSDRVLKELVFIGSSEGREVYHAWRTLHSPK